jgi:hypothetical protein
MQKFWDVKDMPLRQHLPTFRRSVASPSSGSNSDKRISLTSIQNSILNANILAGDLFLLEENVFQIRYGNETNGRNCIKSMLHYKHSIPATCWPLLRSS